jgi:pyridoxal phosphate enzyme (YggS family)
MDLRLEIQGNLARVRERVSAAAQRAGREPSEVTVVAVTKTHPADVVAMAYQAGVRDFGENRVEEAIDKIPVVQADIVDQPLCWHMIGHLQSRKARRAVALFDWIHSVDSLRLAERISRACDESGKTVRLLLEVNVSGEPTKYGFDVSLASGAMATGAFLVDVERILALPHLKLCGLMTMAPIVAQAEQARPVFSALRVLRDDLKHRFPEVGWGELSMGMTDDFEVAIEEGATMVRVGRAIFGERNRFGWRD